MVTGSRLQAGSQEFESPRLHHFLRVGGPCSAHPLPVWVVGRGSPPRAVLAIARAVLPEAPSAHNGLRNGALRAQGLRRLLPVGPQPRPLEDFAPLRRLIFLRAGFACAFYVAVHIGVSWKVPAGSAAPSDAWAFDLPRGYGRVSACAGSSITPCARLLRIGSGGLWRRRRSCRVASGSRSGRIARPCEPHG